MKPVDMKVSRKAQETALGYNIAGAQGKGKVYPWGLELRLDATALDKLGIKDMPDTETECVLTGMAVVTEVRKSANPGGEKTRHVTLQITKLALEHGEDAEKAFADGYRKGPKRAKGY